MRRHVLLVAALAGGIAHADTGGTLPNGGMVVFLGADQLGLLINENGGDAAPPSTVNAQKRYFDTAHCFCSQNMTGMEQTFQQKVQEVGGTSTISPTIPVEIWIGTGCDNDTTRPLQCRRIDADTFADINQLAIAPQAFTMSIKDLMTPIPVDGSGTCPAFQGQETVWAIADADRNGLPDYFVTQTYDVDTQPPPLPTDFNAQPSENGILISWTPPNDVSDIWYYQALCADPNGQPAKTAPTGCTDPDSSTANCPRYVRAMDLCGAADNPLSPTSLTDDSSADAGIANVPADMVAADPRFICGETPDKTAHSISIDGLTNNTPYSVAIVAVDISGNYTGTYFTTTVTPKAVTDLWEDLHNRGSKVEGGFCLIAETYGDDNPLTQAMRSFRDDNLASTAFGRWLIDVYYKTVGKGGAIVHAWWPLRIIAGILLLPLIVIALAWHFLTLPGLVALIAFGWLMRRRRWRIPRFAATATAAAVVLLPLSARADSITPYWQQESVAADEDQGVSEPGQVTWIAGIRLGPYTPQIDAQLGMDPGPYKQMFGGYAIMPQLDVDRVLWHGVGQLGVGLSVGYMSKSAHPFVEGSDPNDPNRPRSPGDTNSFRLIPIAATAVYRFTMLDDDYGIPIVPYARGGLAYYIWWIKATHNLAQVCNGDGMEPDCSQNKAVGASLGVVGSIGLAIRAERIDANAAKSMQQSGLEHAGFYGEISFAKVDGFGSESKLSVGDTTWFAGVNFEF
jgi:hypothetical protein